MDPYKFLGISLNPDGSVTRAATFPLVPASPVEGEEVAGATVLSKDVPLNPATSTSLRLFLPSAAAAANPNPKLPLIVHFHGGGFVLFGTATPFVHASCERLAAAVPAVVASVDYRLAPEHRLPAAIDDAVDALLWARSASSDPWLLRADPSRCFLMGSSAGATIALHAALRARTLDLDPLKLTGLILNQPFFGGNERTASENAMPHDKVVPLAVADLMWELALPEGSDRDHEYANPREEGLEGLPPCLVRGYKGDPLIDRQRVFAGMLERRGVRVVARVEGEGHHGVELFRPEKAAEFVADVASFVRRCHGGDGEEEEEDDGDGAAQRRERL
uniref:Alpha/beta hydrolase fold-3 domain-containing protein n=1 Tax=Ananas comosus var. bracteatus TaxID=296719 RepID=A0A6V7QVD5_ANACO